MSFVKYFSSFLLITIACNVLAYQFKPSQVEVMASSPLCQKALAGRAGLEQSYRQSEAEKALIWKTGGWHYCGGAIRIRRAENTIGEKDKKELFKLAIEDIKYSYSRIGKSDLWAAEMGTEMARAYKGLNSNEKAFEYLNTVLQYHPDYEPAYTMYGLIYYDEKDYAKAKEYFLKALDVGYGRSAQTVYFLGLTTFRMGDFESAKKYSAEAKQLGYPLKGLDNMLARAKQ